MNMRNIYIYMLLAVTTLTLSSCDDFLDKLPDNRMDLNSKEKVQKYLVSAYPDHNPAYLTELYSDNADENISRPSFCMERHHRDARQRVAAGAVE